MKKFQIITNSELLNFFSHKYEGLFNSIYVTKFDPKANAVTIHFYKYLGNGFNRLTDNKANLIKLIGRHISISKKKTNQNFILSK